MEFVWPLQNQTLADRMIRFMHQNKGIGLAAPQIGHSLRLFVMQVDGQPRICFNPEILDFGDIIIDFNEACLSFPGESCIISRPETITVRYQDAQGEWTQHSLTGLEARCFQHELDHLDGVTMHDRHKEQHAEQS